MRPRRRTGRLRNWPRVQDLVALGRRLANPSLRTVHRLRRDAADELLQPFPDTMPDRHPALFAFARDYLAARAAPRLLSFGCSTGEEPLSLAAYLPEAIVDGYDINPRSIAIARAKAARSQAGRRINLVLSGQPPQLAGHYDAIFCLSVLRHGELDAFRPEDCSAILPHARFASVVTALDHALRPGGLLIIWGSNFRFGDCAEAQRYTPLPVPGASPHRGPVYGPDDRLIDCRGNSDFVFRKDRD